MSLYNNYITFITSNIKWLNKEEQIDLLSILYKYDNKLICKTKNNEVIINFNEIPIHMLSKMKDFVENRL